jgi:putative component of toxin-antitoxin plasmid stabilization module
MFSLRDYSRFTITVRGEPKFASFFLNLRDMQLKKRIDGVLDTIKEHPDAGDLVEHALWPDAYERLALDNLFRIEVGKGQRMTYTIRIEGVNLDVDIIEFFRTHKEYEKRFHY